MHESSPNSFPQEGTPFTRNTSVRGLLESLESTVMAVCSRPDVQVRDDVVEQALISKMEDPEGQRPVNGI